MSNLTTFNYQSLNVRTFHENGEVLFVAKDVCDVLGYQNAPRSTTDHVDPEDIRFRYTLTEGGRQKVLCINESGLYALIMNSKKSEAKAFKHWVTSEVLPSIRKTGSYLSGVKKSDDFKEAMLIGKYYKKLSKIVGASESLANALTVQVVHRETGVDIKDSLIENKSDIQEPLITVTDIAIHMNIGRNKVNPILIERGLQTAHRGPSGNIRYELTDKGKQCGQYLDTGKKHSDGTPVYQIKWYKDRLIKAVSS